MTLILHEIKSSGKPQSKASIREPAATFTENFPEWVSQRTRFIKINKPAFDPCLSIKAFGSYDEAFQWFRHHVRRVYKLEQLLNVFFKSTRLISFFRPLLGKFMLRFLRIIFRQLSIAILGPNFQSQLAGCRSQRLQKKFAQRRAGLGWGEARIFPVEPSRILGLSSSRLRFHPSSTLTSWLLLHAR